MDPVGCLAFPDVEELDLVGPWELFGLWHAKAGGPRCVMLAETASPVRGRHGLRLVPDATFDEAPSLSALLVPGGKGTRRLGAASAATSFVARRAASVDALLSVCTGVRVLHAAGLVAGRRITTHWSALDEARSWAAAQVVEARVVRDGPVWTAAGVSAGMDMALAYIRATDGAGTAADVRRHAEYFPNAPASDASDWPDAPAYLDDV
jgi:transcriptional regulator GlxA family with amidase domain